MNFSQFLAVRYLQPKRTFVSVITIISLAGVALGVAALLVVVSVMAGFKKEITEMILGFEPHIVINNNPVGSNPQPEDNWEAIIAETTKISGIASASPVVAGQVILEANSRRFTPPMIAVDPTDEAMKAKLSALIKEGTFDLEGDADGDKVIIGETIANTMGLKLGDTITLYSPQNFEQIADAFTRIEQEDESGGERKAAMENLRELLLPFELKISGIFDSIRYGDHVVVPLNIGQELYDLGWAVHYVALETTDPYDAGSIALEVQQAIEYPRVATTWMDMNERWFRAIFIERMMMYLLLFLIVVVAAFCIMNTMITVTVQKRREIGVMKALGAKASGIVKIFLYQGIIVGGIGTLLGIGLGFLALSQRNRLHFLFDPGVYHLPEIPVDIRGLDIVIICIGSFLLCALAALVPAYQAARVDPAKALRNL